MKVREEEEEEEGKWPRVHVFTSRGCVNEKCSGGKRADIFPGEEGSPPLMPPYPVRLIMVLNVFAPHSSIPPARKCTSSTFDPPPPFPGPLFPGSTPGPQGEGDMIFVSN